MSERKKHIAVLKEMLAWMNMSSEIIEKDDPFFRVHEHRKKAVKYAISSLETDEAYNLMYEEPEFCEDCIDRELFIRDLYCKAQGETSINIHWLEGYIKKFPCVLPKLDESQLHKVAKEELKVQGRKA